jgi:hypothetical protein
MLGSMIDLVSTIDDRPQRIAKRNLRLNLRLLRLPRLKATVKDVLNFGLTLQYRERIQKKAFTQARRYLDLVGDHKISDLVGILERSDVFSSDIPTEASLSIPSILQYARDGYHGVVNVYPFTCMPSTTTSAVVRPLVNAWRFHYLDTPYDSSSQPGREAAIRTFMYQAHQHLNRNMPKN